MRIPRLYLPAPLRTGDEVDLDERCHRHAIQVLRLRVGAPLVLFNGDGNDYTAELSHSERRHARARVLGSTPNPAESPLAVTLAQGIAKGDHMDYSLQKAVELGVQVIVPVLCERSVLRLDDRRLEKKLEHWQGILISACEQSGRSRLPQLAPIQPLDDWLAQFAGHGVVLDPRAEQGLATLAPPVGGCSALVGPEGGLTDEELDKARVAGLNGIRLGPRILRTETAASTILAALQLLWGDLEGAQDN
ncbi:MAG TPA: 16S rRNA (uracil(1498)-N(3))-methyltransferase [Thioalkalivibrio sp.]|nr:16S rRNA (uracil(1498)-N(3))-methyltransferase [Thioalkalivibrio sp.]